MQCPRSLNQPINDDRTENRILLCSIVVNAFMYYCRTGRVGMDPTYPSPIWEDGENEEMRSSLIQRKVEVVKSSQPKDQNLCRAQTLLVKITRLLTFVRNSPHYDQLFQHVLHSTVSLCIICKTPLAGRCRPEGGRDLITSFISPRPPWIISYSTSFMSTKHDGPMTFKQTRQNLECP